MSRNPRTKAGRRLLASLHAEAPVLVSIEQDADSIAAIEDEAAATERRLTVERIDWNRVGALISDALDYTNDGAVIAKVIRDDLATADVDEEAGTDA